MKFLVSLVLASALLRIADVAEAHPGGTASDGCHYCRTNCSRWNVPANRRHCHGGRSTPAPSAPSQQVKSCTAATGTWRGISVAPECRCTSYDRDDYAHPASVEARIADRLCGMFSPYDGTQFESLRDSQVEKLNTRE